MMWRRHHFLGERSNSRSSKNCFHDLPSLAVLSRPSHAHPWTGPWRHEDTCVVSWFRARSLPRKVQLDVHEGRIPLHPTVDTAY